MALPDHLQHTCKQVNLTCNVCNFVAKREAIYAHYVCKEFYLKEKAEGNERIEKLLKEKAEDQ
jgi:hypothetical protein